MGSETKGLTGLPGRLPIPVLKSRYPIRILTDLRGLMPLFPRRGCLPVVASTVAREDAIPRDSSHEAMFCFQCEQTKNRTGCTSLGVCGKTADVAGLQDLLFHTCKGVGMYAHRAAKLGVRDPTVDAFVQEAMFSTLTNVDFDPSRFRDFLRRGRNVRNRARALYERACLDAGSEIESLDGPAAWEYDETASDDELAGQAAAVGLLERRRALGEDVSGLQELVTYGLKGMASYSHHAKVLGVNDPVTDAFVHETLNVLANESPDADLLLQHALKVGENNIRVMRNLDRGATERYGHPEPTVVRTTAVKGKAILVSGHDLRDVELVLKATEGTGVKVYTHGELLPAHGYPGLKGYPHLVGNFGGAWQLQKWEFAIFPGPIVATTNCMIEPQPSYIDRLFTRGVVGWPGVSHIANDDFSDVVAMAERMDGFLQDEIEQHTMTGFARNAVISQAEKIVDLVNAGKLKHLFLIGGCDGAENKERSYFRDLAFSTPSDSIVLTLACGKYRFNKHFDDFGNIDGIPRLLDVGQCNDAYSAIEIASALASALGTDVNSLPLSFAVSWFEQKAVAVLLSLLSLNIQRIYLGPRLPAFLTPSILKILNEKFQLKAAGDAQEDLAEMLAKSVQ